MITVYLMIRVLFTVEVWAGMRFNMFRCSPITGAH